VNASMSHPVTLEIRRGHLIGLLVAAAGMAAALTWLLVAFAFDSGAASTPQSGSRPGAGTPATITSTSFPPGYRGMP
jgi:hypothetical protein